MAINSLHEKPKDNAIRRVLKQGLISICGMCGKRYGSDDKAEACLSQCVANYMAKQPVEDKTQKSGTAYRCSYCKRVYEKIEQAKECAKGCKTTINKRLEAESRIKSGQSREEKMQALAAFSSNGTVAPAAKQLAPKMPAPPVTKAKAKPQAPIPASALKPREIPPEQALAPIEDNTFPIAIELPPTKKGLANPSEGTKFDRVGNSYICLECKTKYSKYKDAISCYDLHKTMEALAPPPQKNSEGLEKFLRDGAKYVCRNCSAKYFSRDEVVSCFDGHPPDEDQGVTRTVEARPNAAGEAEVDKKSSLETLRASRASSKSEDEKFIRNGAKYICRTCNKKYFTRAEVLVCFDGHLDLETRDSEPAGEVLDTLASEPITKEKVKGYRPPKSKEGEGKFFRDGAKYVCKKCNTKYFTRPEVIECFDKH